MPEAQANFVWLPLAELSQVFDAACVDRSVAVRNLGAGVRISSGGQQGPDRVLEVAAEFRAQHFG